MVDPDPAGDHCRMSTQPQPRPQSKPKSKPRQSRQSRPRSPRAGKRRLMTPRQREYQLLLRLKATPSEQILLGMLDSHPATHGRFEFQAHVCGYFPDFAFHVAKLIVELDGACQDR